MAGGPEAVGVGTGGVGGGVGVVGAGDAVVGVAGGVVVVGAVGGEVSPQAQAPRITSSATVARIVVSGSTGGQRPAASTPSSALTCAVAVRLPDRPAASTYDTVTITRSVLRSFEIVSSGSP